MKRRAPDRGGGETSAKVLCPGISGSSTKRAGPFILGPRLGNSSVPSIVQCLARKDGTDDFYQLKILTLEDKNDHGTETQEERRRGKMLLHTEFSLLSLLHNQDGVVHHHGLFQCWTASVPMTSVTRQLSSSISSIMSSKRSGLVNERPLSSSMTLCGWWKPCTRVWPKYWSFSFRNCPSKGQAGEISFPLTGYSFLGQFLSQGL
ncbi:serine/threonine-protein kinase 40-like isoform X3 [Ahaetulla prasina]|uniref:serine/threonine-protein kinase 40-like isoform X3 n=1 Tax=Ahaetulla prasina TaxID=499056 RepID=UPI002647C920|nr:serine/threonine-protein kinase 40-like isoform X3 [Ahaetulla prasina]